VIAWFLSMAMVASGTASVEHESDLVIRALQGLQSASLRERVSVAHAVKRLRIPLPFDVAPQLHSLLIDPAINPRKIERAGWMLLVAAGRFPVGDPEAVAHWLEGDDLAQALLSQSHVTVERVEQVLTRLRRWLLLDERASEFPRSVAALVAQATHNAGAWLIDAAEMAYLKSYDGVLRAAYLPDPPAERQTPQFDDPVTRAVAAQYDAWPYPAWQRGTAGQGESFTQVIGAIAPDAPQGLPENARMLIAGCGTGLQAVNWAQRFPQLSITAIDISAGALDYAMARSPSSLTNLHFHQCDLHHAGRFGTFDAIVVTGVLHHLPCPEKGWAALTRLLNPGGIMRVMLYSALARLPVRACQARIADLARLPVDDDLLRAVRARLIAGQPNDVTRSPDFFHLGGVHDLLLHRHEEVFDVPRIQRALGALNLKLLRMRLPQREAKSYRAAYPLDRYCRDFLTLAAFERTHPRTFAGMYDFWCCNALCSG
jgi:SAM-dependent methyltransferase